MTTPGEAEQGDANREFNEPLLDHSNSPWSPNRGEAEFPRSMSASIDASGELGASHSARDASVPTPERQPPTPLESLDYEPINNDVGRAEYKRRFGASTSSTSNGINNNSSKKHIYGYTGLTLIKTLLTLVIGTVIGVTAFTIDTVVDLMFKFKRKEVLEGMFLFGDGGDGFNANATDINGTTAMSKHTDSSHYLLQTLGWYQLICTILVFIPSVLCVFWSPQASGGGVTGVMAHLNGTKVPGLLELKALLAKVIGVICAVGSSLAVGPEGPMVHIGAAVASCVVLMGPKRWLGGQGSSIDVGNDAGESDDDTDASDEETHSSTRPDTALHHALHRQQKQKGLQTLLLDLASHTTQREFVSAGAAAGLAAAFGAPMGGVLFSLEEASTYWSRKVMWRSFLCASMASISLSMCRATGGSGMLFLGDAVRAQTPRDYVHQLPFFIITAMVGGVLGVLFNLLTWFLAKWVRPKANRKVSRVLECVLVVVLTGTVRFLAAEYFGTCVDAPVSWKQLYTRNEEPFGVRWRCENNNTVNDVATLLFSTPNKAVGWMLSMGELDDNSIDGSVNSGYGFTVKGLGITSVVYVLLMTAAYGLAVPGGVFLPSVFLGATYGGAVGLLVRNILPNHWDVQPGVYALIGATATLAGVFRSSISLVVIMVEGTGGINFTFLVIVAVVVSNATCGFFKRFKVLSNGVYHSDLERNDAVVFLPNEPARGLYCLTAVDLMGAEGVDVVTVREHETLEHVSYVLKETNHNGFPVVDSDDRLVGVASRVALSVLAKYFLTNSSYEENSTSGSIIGTSHRSKRKLDVKMRVAHLWDTEGETQRGMDDFASSTSEQILDVASFMHRAPLSVHCDYPAQRAHLLFTTLGLRHLCVTDSSNKVVGIITRKDVMKADDW